MNYKIELTQSELLHMADFSIESPKGFSVDVEFTEESKYVNSKFHEITWVHINYDDMATQGIISKPSKVAFESDILRSGFYHSVNDINKICIYEN